MYNILKRCGNLVSNLISPPFCENCKDLIESRTIFCDSCFDIIKPIVSVKLPVNAQYSITVHAISDYGEPLKSLILAKRISNQLAGRHLGELMWSKTSLKNIDFDYLIPVPLHWTRYIVRGYNQTEIMAEVIALKSGKPVTNILKRHKYTAYQSSLDVEGRLKNVKNVFALNSDINIAAYESKYYGKHLVIVDDLLTSGSTLISAAKELAKLKPASITAIVACRVK